MPKNRDLVIRAADELMLAIFKEIEEGRLPKRGTLAKSLITYGSIRFNAVGQEIFPLIRRFMVEQMEKKGKDNPKSSPPG